VASMKERPKKKSAQAADALDDTDRKLLNLLQWEFPHAVRPWRELGAKLNLPEADVLARTRALREGGVIRQIGAIFDTHRLGYTSALIAVRTEPAQLEKVAQALNRHPGVSHNYQREHQFNLWFTLAVPPGASLEAEVKRITDLPGVEQVRLLPTIKLFKIGVKLDMERDEKDLDRDEAPTAKPTQPARPLVEQDKTLIRVTQEDLPLTEEPFAQQARDAGVSQEQLIAWLREMEAMGFMRRFAAVLRHHKAGFTDNGMLTWCVPAEKIEEAGRAAAAFPQVSHCYQRPTYPDWPYNLFTMVHARTPEDCQEVLAAISKATGVNTYAALYSVKEYKKVRMQYFTPEVEAWEAQHR
jgi:siroheme decarboxylase